MGIWSITGKRLKDFYCVGVGIWCGVVEDWVKNLWRERMDRRCTSVSAPLLIDVLFGPVMLAEVEW